jgi:hypothetical protein
VCNQRTRNKNNFFTLPGSDAEQTATSNGNGIITKLPQIKGKNPKASFGNPFRGKPWNVKRKDRINNRCSGKMAAIALEKNYIP